MKTLYLKLIELLSQIPEIKYIDLNYGQLQEEKPPLVYPAVLINMNASSDDVDGFFQIYTANIELTIICKMLGESNQKAPELIRFQALHYLDISEKIYLKLQGFSDDNFDSFTRKGLADPNIRKGLKTTVHRYETSWRANLHQSKADEFSWARYLRFLSLQDFERRENLYWPPSLLYRIDGTKLPLHNFEYEGSQDRYSALQDLYYILPFIDDHQRNPHAYNITRNWLSCIYMQDDKGFGSRSFLIHSVKKGSKARASECVAIFHNREDIGNNIYKLRGWFLQGMMKRVVSVIIIIEDEITYYSRQDIINYNA
ncbi:MAG: hypothetical protein LC112_07715 [Flavobacteriales bacterium]|nr:hypothetical protein [Flavobacteriales bacterium]